MTAKSAPALIAFIILAASAAWAADNPQKIRIAFPSPAFSYMPFYVAQEKGLLKKAGLESEYIQMRTGIMPQAVINGNIDFFTSPSTGISAAVGGLPLVIALNLYTGSPWILVTGKEITKPRDLVGKSVAISGIRNSPHYYLLAALKKWEIPEKDVALISTGGTASSFAALTSHQVAGAVLTPPFDDKAVTLGFKKFQFLGDLADVPYVGLVTSQAEMKTRRDLVQKTIAVLLEAAAWVRANRDESVKMIADKFKVTPAEAGRTYETLISLLTKDGQMNPKVARGYLDILRQERPIPADIDPQKFLDFSLLPGIK
ncbi:MAG TPA: ABC transporter substrate-binding protein [Candidatus Binatia bacterium]|nr:ABC transporter substrate-binding protein [Candidatus Binatia bacterium]